MCSLGRGFRIRRQVVVSQLRAAQRDSITCRQISYRYDSSASSPSPLPPQLEEDEKLWCLPPLAGASGCACRSLGVGRLQTMGALPRRAWRISAIEFTRKISPPPNSCHSLGVHWATVAWVAENTSIKRSTSCLVLGLIIWLLGVAVLLSFNEWKDIKIVFNLNIFDTLDKLTSTILLPLGGLLMAIFAGYFMKNNHVQEELNLNNLAFKLWRFTNNILSPVAIAGVFLYLFGIIS